MKTFKKEDYEVTYDDSETAQLEIFVALLGWYMGNHVYTGEQIYQNDLDFQEILSRVAEKGFKFKIKYLED